MQDLGLAHRLLATEHSPARRLDTEQNLITLARSYFSWSRFNHALDQFCILNYLVLKLKSDLIRMKKDILWDLFQKALKDSSRTTESAEELIKKVVDGYTQTLTAVGTIPMYLWEDVIADLQAEVTEMYRKKTYGHHSLQDYHRHHRLRNKQK